MRNAAHAFCRMFFSLGLADVFHLIRLGLGVVGTKPTKVKSPVLTSYQGYVPCTCHVSNVLNLVTCWWWMPGVSDYAVTVFPFLCAVLSEPTLRANVKLHLLGIVF